jgi:hypothetical protein
VNNTQVFVTLCESTDSITRDAVLETMLSWPYDSFADPNSPAMTYEYELGTAFIEMGEFDAALSILDRFMDGRIEDLSSIAWFRSGQSPMARAFSCDPRALARFQKADLPPRPENIQCP